MAKPSIVPTFATDANFTNGPDAGTATKVAPTSGELAEGLVPGTKPAAQKLNWWRNLVGRWFEFLDPIFEANGSIKLPIDEHVTVQGAGMYKHGTRTIRIPAIAGSWARSSVVAGTWFTTESGGIEPTTDTATFYWKVPIVLEAGKRILAVRFKVKDAAGPTRFACDVNPVSGYDTSGASIGSGNVLSAGDGTDQTLVLPGLDVSPHVVQANQAYIASFLIVSGAGAPVFAYGVEVDYDQP